MKKGFINDFTYVQPESTDISFLTKKFFKDGITHITFNDEFNTELKIGILPKTLLCLQFGHDYNQDIIPKVLPESLKIIRFGNDFNIKLTERVLPTNLTELRLGLSYNHDLTEDIVPKQLQYLYVGKNFNSLIWFPKTLTKFGLNGNMKNNACLNNIPSTVETLYISRLTFAITNLPPTISKIILKNYNRKILSFLTKLPLNCMVTDIDGDEIL